MYNMLYSRKQLKSLSFEDLSIPLGRYIYKLKKNELGKLKMHEKDFFFQNLKILYKDKGTKKMPAFDLRKIKEAKEYLFYNIILIYAKSYIDFDSISMGFRGKIQANEVRKDKRFFYEYINIWRNQVKTRKGIYFSEIFNAISPKIKALDRSMSAENFSSANIKDSYNKQNTFIWAIFFHIYYKIKLYFDEKREKYENRTINGFIIRFDIYSFVHILSRHYYPDMNHGMGVSLNSMIKIIDMEELPTSILKLIELYVQHSTINPETEYLLFIIEGEKYILWLKSGISNYPADFQVRSFYKCEEQRDLDRFAGKRVFEISESILGVY